MSTQSVNPVSTTMVTRNNPASLPANEIRVKFANFMQDLEGREKFVDRVISQAMKGRDFSPGELIAIQAGVYRYTQQMEAFSKLVDRATGAVRRTLEAGG